MQSPFIKNRNKTTASILSTTMALAMVSFFVAPAAHAEETNEEIQGTVVYEESTPSPEETSTETATSWFIGAYAYETEYYDGSSAPYMEWWSDQTVASNYGVYFVDSSNDSIFYASNDSTVDYGGEFTPDIPIGESRTYYAYIAEWDATYDTGSDFTDVKTISEGVTITHLSSTPPEEGNNVTASFYADDYVFSTDEQAPTLTWDVQGMSVDSPQGIYIVSEETGEILHSSQDASGQFQSARFWHEDGKNYTFYVADWNASAVNFSELTNLATDVQWAYISRAQWSVILEFDAYQNPSETVKNLTVVTNQSVADTSTPQPVWAVYVVDQTTGNVVDTITGMDKVQVIDYVNFVPGHIYTAYVAEYSNPAPATVQDLVDVQAVSENLVY